MRTIPRPVLLALFTAGGTFLGLLPGVLLTSASAAEADGSDVDPRRVARRQWSASVRWENDTFGGTDRFYTDGVSLSVAHTGPSWMDGLAECLPWGEGRRTVSYDLLQAMTTPADIGRVVPDPADRPYSGILSIGLALHVERSNSYHGLRFLTGVVGPWSLAEETQREVHQLADSQQPRGWDHQLDNEPILNLVYEYRRRFRLVGQRDGWTVEALPIVGGMLGNVITQGQLSGLLRVGYRIPDDFGPTLARGMGHLPPSPPRAGATSRSNWGFSLYGAASGNLVLRDITLDGNTFEDSPRVDKNVFVPAGGVGIAVGNRRFLASFTYVFWGEEFEAQPEYSKFGALAFSFRF